MNVEVGKAMLCEIGVSERMRKEYGDLEALGDSLEELGQIQTLAVMELPEEDKLSYELLAGGRRYAALVNRFEVGHEVSITIFPADLKPHHKLAIELTENIQRLDMTPHEEALGRKRIHAAFTSIRDHEREADPSLAEWRQKDTAEALGVARVTVTESLQLADAMEAAPEVFKGVKTNREAQNLLAKMMEKFAVDELANRAEAQKESLSERKQRLINAYHLGDFFEWASKQQDSQFDIIEFDPDYGIDFGFSHNATTSKAIQAALTGDYKLVDKGVEEYTRYLRRGLEDCYRLAKSNAWLILWFAQDPWGEIVFSELERAGWEGKRIPGVWDKGVDGRTSAAPDIYLGRVHECFYYCRKGNAVINRRGRADVFRYPRPSKRIHPTEKPTDLMGDIYSTFGTPDSKILIPHLGSGNGILAASNVGMYATGCDLNEGARNAYIGRVMELAEESEDETV